MTSSPQVSKAVPIGQSKKTSDTGKCVGPPEKGKKNIVKTTANTTTLASPSANLRNKL